MGGTLRKTGPAALTFASDDPADMDFWEETTLQVEDGTVRFHADAGAADRRNLAVHVDGSGAVEFASTQHLAEVHLADGAVACVPHGARTLVTGDLQVDETGGVRRTTTSSSTTTARAPTTPFTTPSRDGSPPATTAATGTATRPTRPPASPPPTATPPCTPWACSTTGRPPPASAS